MVLATALASLAVYAENFHDHPFSGDPGDWGSLGDYLGGVINPLISMIALIFLVKAYNTQREELRDTKEALREAAKHSEAAARSQSELALSTVRQLKLAEKNLFLSILLANVETKQNKIRFLQSALEQATVALNNQRGALDMLGSTGDLIHGNTEVDKYRVKILQSIRHEEKEIQALLGSAISPSKTSNYPQPSL